MVTTATASANKTGIETSPAMPGYRPVGVNGVLRDPRFTADSSPLCEPLAASFARRLLARRLRKSDCATKPVTHPSAKQETSQETSSITSVIRVLKVSGGAGSESPRSPRLDTQITR